MVSYDQTIPPGGEGKITLSVSTEGYQGSIRKRARVYNNDPENKLTYLTVMALVKVKEGEELTLSRKPLSPESFSIEPSPSGTTSQVSGQGASGYNMPPKAKQPGADESMIPPPVEDPSAFSPPGEATLSLAVDPNQPPPPGVEPLDPVVNSSVPTPPGKEPIESEPSLKPETESIFPSDTQEQANPQQPN